MGGKISSGLRGRVVFPTLVEVGAAEVVAAIFADEFAARVDEAGGAVGAVDAVVLVGQGAVQVLRIFLGFGGGGSCRHCERVMQSRDIEELLMACVHRMSYGIETGNKRRRNYGS